MTFISQKLRDSARGQNCTFQIPGVCSNNPETVVLCHLPSIAKGMGNKSPDYWAVFGCSECHHAFDNMKMEPLERQIIMTNALFKTLQIWIDGGLLSFPETVKRKKKSTKIIGSRSLYKCPTQ